MHTINLASRVTISLTEQEGVVISRSESTFHESQYLVRHKSAQGDHVETWFIADDLTVKRDVLAEILKDAVSARNANGSYNLRSLCGGRELSKEEDRALLRTLGLDKFGVPL